MIWGQVRMTWQRVFFFSTSVELAYYRYCGSQLHIQQLCSKKKKNVRLCSNCWLLRSERVAAEHARFNKRGSQNVNLPCSLWLISRGWKNCLLIYYERKILLNDWLIWLISTSEQGVVSYIYRRCIYLPVCISSNKRGPQSTIITYYCTTSLGCV
jgi:hypothetical protein